jgi:hypothetical protein
MFHSFFFFLVGLRVVNIPLEQIFHSRYLLPIANMLMSRHKGTVENKNPKKKGARSYHPQIAFLAESKEILQAWFGFNRNLDPAYYLP